jgi:hypothetical protein
MVYDVGCFYHVWIAETWMKCRGLFFALASVSLLVSTSGMSGVQRRELVAV